MVETGVVVSVLEVVVSSMTDEVSKGAVLPSVSDTVVAILVSDFVEVLEAELVLVSSSQPENASDAESKSANKDKGLRFIRIPPMYSFLKRG